MRRFILSMAAVVVSLALVATAEAGPKGGGSKGGSQQSYMSKGTSHDSHNSRDYHLTHGSKLKDGSYFYKGKEHSHWSHRYWYAKYGCYTYYCPSTCCWYYWYEQDICYYPVSYIPTCRPTPCAAPAYAAPANYASGVTQVVNVTNNSPGSATAGAGTAGPTSTPLLPGTPKPPSPPGP